MAEGSRAASSLAFGDFSAEKINRCRITDDCRPRRDSNGPGQCRGGGTWSHRGDNRHSQDDDIRPVGLRSLSMPLEARLARPGPAVGRLGPASLPRVLL